MARGRFHILKNKWNKVLSYPSRSYSGRRQVPKKIEPKSQHYKAIVGVVATASKMMSKSQYITGSQRRWCGKKMRFGSQKINRHLPRGPALPGEAACF